MWRMKHFLIGWLLAIGIAGWAAAQLNFSDSLTKAGIDTQQFSSKEAVNRYDLARLINASLCQDCVLASPQTKGKYTTTRRATTAQDHTIAVDDIVEGKSQFEGEEYGVCVGTVIDRGWMEWYPRTDSPYCHGRFCGTNSVDISETIGTFYKAVRDVEELAPSVDWESVQERKLLSGSNISFPDQQAISSAFERCGESACAPTSAAEMDADRKSVV